MHTEANPHSPPKLLLRSNSGFELQDSSERMQNDMVLTEHTIVCNWCGDILNDLSEKMVHETAHKSNPKAVHAIEEELAEEPDEEGEELAEETDEEDERKVAAVIRFWCPGCTLSFHHLKGIKSHAKYVHKLKITSVKCPKPTCKNTFTKEKTYHVHVGKCTKP